MHWSTQEAYDRAVEVLGPNPPFWPAACGQVPTGRELTTRADLVSCPACLRAMPAQASAPLPPSTPEPQPTTLSTAEAAKRLGVARDRLDRLTYIAEHLPGGPHRAGSGSRRRHYHWPADTLRDWYTAATALEQGRAAKPPATPPRTKRSAT